MGDDGCVTSLFKALKDVIKCLFGLEKTYEKCKKGESSRRDAILDACFKILELLVKGGLFVCSCLVGGGDCSVCC